MDAILIRDLRVETLIGIHKRERHVRQTVSIDLDIGLPGSAVFSSDKVADTIDYEQVALRIRSLAAAGDFRGLDPACQSCHQHTVRERQPHPMHAGAAFDI